MNISTRELECLIALDEHLHFHRAARACDVGQPAFSERLRRLEEKTGLILAERTSRAVAMTPAGQHLAEQARAVMREVSRLREIAGHHRETLSGPLRVGLLPDSGAFPASRIMPALRRAFPDASFSLFREPAHRLTAMLGAGELDCALLPDAGGSTPGTLTLPVRERHVLAFPSDSPRLQAYARMADILRHC